MHNLLQAVRLARRRLLHKKAYSAAVILSLALGIGANTAIFSVVNTVFLRPLPIKDVDRMVVALDMRENYDPFGAALLDEVAIKSKCHSLSGIALGHAQVFRLLGREQPERIAGAAVSSEFMPTMGIEPKLGRAFAPADDKPGAAPVAIISSSLWKTLFGADPAIVGRGMNLDNRDCTIIGVMQDSFDLPQGAKIWTPLATEIEALPMEQQVGHEYYLAARLAPGVSIEQANREIDSIARGLEEAYPQFRKNWGIKLIPLRQELLGDIDGKIRSTLFLLVGIVGFLLLITCANVASLLLARSIERSHETAILAALGANRRWLIGQSLIESVLLSVIGGAVGLALASFAATSLMALQPIYFYSLKDVFQDIRIDARVLGFTFLVSLITGVLFGLAPAIRSSLRPNLLDGLKDSGQRAGRSRGERRMFEALMIGEIAVATILLVGAGLMVKSFHKLNEAKLGFQPANLLASEMSLSEVDYPKHLDRAEFLSRVLEKVRSLPGVTSAGISTNTPLALVSFDSTYTVEGRPPADSASVPITAHRAVTPDYLQTLGVSLLEGRLIQEPDRADTLPVVVITKELARRAWPGEDPIGKHLKLRYPPPPSSPWLTVIGVVDDTKEDRFNFRIDRPAWYIPYAQLDNRMPVTLLVRSVVDPASLAASVRDQIHAVNSNQSVGEAVVMADFIVEFLGPQRFAALLSGIFAGLGLLLAALGICGITAYSTVQRTGEFCIRMAFGASWRDLVRMVVNRGVRIAAAGLALGLAGGIVVGRILSGLLYKVSPTAPDVIFGPAPILLLVVVAAMYLPMLRLIKLEPIEGMRRN